MAIASCMALPVPSAVSDEDETWLVVLQGEVKAIAAGQMTLAASPRALAFTDRPHRDVRMVETDGFVRAMWSEGGEFLLNPPNASLVDTTDRTVAVIEVKEANWGDGLLVVTFTVLEGGLPSVGDHIALTLDDLSGFDQPTGNVYP